ncbi:hypothetical protein FRB94_008944 [Tulasnella sp. JGI-2019a]|nr:hypothetical protein FRB94_008944 [Tulasnella sp. JGI-2019a]
MSSYRAASFSPISIPKSSAPSSNGDNSCPPSPSSLYSRTSSLSSDTSSSADHGLTQYPIEQLLLLASSPLVQAQRHHVASALGRLGLPEIRKPKAAKKSNARRSPPRNNITPATAPIAIARNPAAAGNERHHRQSSHSSSSSDSGRSSGSWKHSWNEVATLQTWRRS